MGNKTDKLFRKIFLGLLTLAAMLAFILSIHLFIGTPLNSGILWGGSVLTYLIVNLIIDISGIYNRLIILGAGIVMLTVFFISIIKWSVVPSLVTGMIIMVICGLLYISFLHG